MSDSISSASGALMNTVNDVHWRTRRNEWKWNLIMLSQIKVNRWSSSWALESCLVIHGYICLFLRCYYDFVRFFQFHTYLYNVSTFSYNPPNSYMTYHNWMVIPAPTSSRTINNQCTMILLMNLEPVMDLSDNDKWKWTYSIKITPIFHFNQTFMTVLK